ncbi:MAG: DEAD/DEAH box helicase, partial [archaeon]
MAQKVLKTERIIIMADNREFASKVVKELARLDCIVKPKQLEVGDYILSDRVCAERKTAADFLGSVFDQRIFRQLKDLKESFEKPVLIIEGYDLYSERSVHPNAVRGALACIAIDYAMPILWTETPEETAAILYWMARREQVEEERCLSIRGQTRAKTLREQQEFLVAG